MTSKIEDLASEIQRQVGKLPNRKLDSDMLLVTPGELFSIVCGVLGAAAPVAACPMTDEQTQANYYLGEIYGYLANVCPPGIADEAFRNVPDSILPYSARTEILPLHTEQGDANGKRMGLAQQDCGAGKQTDGVVAAAAPVACPWDSLKGPQDLDTLVTKAADIAALPEDHPYKQAISQMRNW